MECQAGSLTNYSTSLATVSQQAWIQNLSIKENILYGTMEATNEEIRASA